jgi:hypothetical protein
MALGQSIEVNSFTKHGAVWYCGEFLGQAGMLRVKSSPGFLNQPVIVQWTMKPVC